MSDASDKAIAQLDGTVTDGAGDAPSNVDDRGSPDGAGSSEQGFPESGGEGDENIDAPGSRTCPGSSIVADPGPTIRACIMGTALIACTYASGDLCVCLSNDPTGCPPGRCPAGGSCTNLCGPTEFALFCGGIPPIPAPDGAPNAYVSYQQAPSVCVQRGPIDSEGENVCCPCD